MSVTAQLNPEALAKRIEVLIERRQFAPALRLIPAVAALAPGQALPAILAAQLALAQGDHAKANQELDAALATWPEQGDLLRLRAQLAIACCDFAGAAQAAPAAVIANSDDTVAKSLLGRALLSLGDSAQARVCLEEALAADPRDVPGTLALAEAAPEQAALMLAAASARMPGNPLLRSALIRALINNREPKAARQAADAAREMRALDADGLVLAGHAAALADDWPEARRLWQEALRHEPRHASALYRLATDRARKTDRLNSSVIAMANNLGADTVELAALAGGTIVPGRIRTALAAVPVTGRVLDLGCGTGLSALAGHDLGLEWEGVEAASRLAAIARGRGLYREVHEGDPLDFLTRSSDHWQAIALGFTAGLVRRLEDFFAALAAHLLPGGIAVGAIVLAPAGRFGPFGCFEHTPEEIDIAARRAGLASILNGNETLLTIDGLPIRGSIVTLRAP